MKSYFKHKMRSKNPAVIVGTIIFIAILAVIFIAAFGFVIMHLWNWLIPEIFGFTTITYWQAMGLALLSRLLFGGFGSDKSSKKHKRDRCKNGSSKSDFSKWKYYEKFWAEQGEEAYNQYINKQDEITAIKNPEKE